jgi:hypothetical protein
LIRRSVPIVRESIFNSEVCPRCQRICLQFRGLSPLLENLSFYNSEVCPRCQEYAVLIQRSVPVSQRICRFGFGGLSPLLENLSSIRRSVPAVKNMPFCFRGLSPFVRESVFNSEVCPHCQESVVLIQRSVPAVKESVVLDSEVCPHC